MLPEALLPFRLVDGRVLPGFLDAHDRPWVSVLMDEIDRFCGRPIHELTLRLQEPMPCPLPAWKARAAKAVILQVWKTAPDQMHAPSKVRAALFTSATKSRSRDEALALAGQHLNMEPAAILRSLFADLPGERLLYAPSMIPSPDEIILRTNQSIARSLLFHARQVRIRADGQLRPVVRQAKLRGLICTIIDREPPILILSGPFSLFRHTLLYGRALGELVQFLAATPRFALRAPCVLRDQEAELWLSERDPIFPAAPPKPFDSKLEARFAKDLKRLFPDWDLLREPEAVRAGGTILFPDFLLRHRWLTERQFLVGIIRAGFFNQARVAGQVHQFTGGVNPHPVKHFKFALAERGCQFVFHGDR